MATSNAAMPTVSSPRRRSASKRCRAAIGLVAVALWLWPHAAEATVYLSTEQALRLAFPSAQTITPADVTLTPEQQQRAAAMAGGPVPAAGPWTIYTATAGEQLLGRAVVMEEIGKYEPITFLVAAGPDGRVLDVLILVYRESRGGEVRRPNFLRQYRGKAAQDPIKVSQDIVNITGATLSARAVSVGVRRALALFSVVYGTVPAVAP